MIKKTFSLIVLFLLVFSTFTVAQTEETADPCSGFFGWLGCWLFGSSEARAGKGWFDRTDALVGKAEEPIGNPLLESFKNQVGIRDDATDEQINKLYAATYGNVEQAKNVYAAGEYNINKAIGIAEESPSPTLPGVVVKPEEPSQETTIGKLNALTLEAEADRNENAAQALKQLAKDNPDNPNVQLYLDYAKALEDEAKAFRANAADLRAKDAKSQSSTATPKPVAAPTQPPAPSAKGAPAAPGSPAAPATPAPAPTPSVDQGAQNDIRITEEMGKKALDKAELLLGKEEFKKYTDANLVTAYSLLDSMYQPNYGDAGKVTEYTEKKQTDNSNNPLTKFQLSNGGTLIAVEKENYITLYHEAPGPTLGSLDRRQTLRKDGVTIATQTNEEFVKNTLVVNKETLKVAKGTDVNALTSGKAVPFFSEKGEKIGEAQAAGDQVVITNFDEETQKTLNTKTGEALDLIGDYYTKTGFLPSGGTWTTTEKAAGGTAKQVKYVLDYDYQGTGDERTLSKVDLYDVQGNRAGAQFDNDGDKKPDVAYRQVGDNLVVTDLKGVALPMVYSKNRDGKWVDEKNRLIDNKDVEAKLNVAYTSSGMKTTQKVLESIYALTNSIKSYPAISKLLFGETAAYQDWQSTMDKAFAPMLGSNWFPSAICESTEKWRDNIPQGKAVIKTASGTYQAVASIQMEKSEKKSPILCQKNPDEEADEQWICDFGQVCVDEQFCYADEDDEKPLQGYFYKITWAVSAPQDDALTLYVDENGVAVSFNVYIDTIADGGIGAGAVPLYNRMGNLVSPIMLENGASDKDAIIKYSPKEYNEACIVWHQAPSTVNAFSGTTEIPDVCFTATTSSAGRVEWEQAGQSSAKVSENKGEISRNSNW